MRRKRRPLERLEELVPPPERPFDPGPEGRRDAVERALGVALPEDLYRLSLRYGSGSFGVEGEPTLITLFNPFCDGYFDRVSSWAESYRRTAALPAAGRSSCWTPRTGSTGSTCR
jgi:hypothetical protein